MKTPVPVVDVPHCADTNAVFVLLAPEKQKERSE